MPSTSADILELIAGYVSCPFTLLALLELLPLQALSRPFQCLRRLAGTVPVARLWPELSYAAVAAEADTFVLGMVWLKRVHVLRLDIWPRPEHISILSHLPMTLSIAVPVPIEFASTWRGRQLEACALNVRRGDKEAHLEAVAAWIQSAPQLRRLRLSFDSAAATPATEALVRAICSLKALTSLHLDVFWLDTCPPFVLQQLLRWLGRHRAIDVGFGDLRGSTALARALHASRSVQSVTLSHTEHMTSVYLDAPLPTHLRRLTLTSRRLPYARRLASALLGARLTHLALRLEAVQETDLVDVIASIASLSHLESLHIKARPLQPATADVLAATVAGLPRLRAFKFDCWPGFLDSVLYLRLAAVVPRCLVLHSLVLRDVRWSAEGLGRWRDALATSPNVRHLCVRRGKFAAHWDDAPTSVCCHVVTAPCHLVDTEWGVSPKKLGALGFL
ncbi:hypothetical protein SDRG_16444 [Saprolegnia diclina VS20]|uniref:F-box domain-containing protein n=1 Tax=Saprolegnia diclina (strain VS20) TaxID=1156394 RepID=T0PTY6_SAPDV|nr:hypothetical protein SDRG_16444 [Saprolegnia diclina VS20]EQC25706.1 hypothetical protein SDRG_16444 [Saprolegnia diclina VS20]|eukprot:XP_008620876.1 hypothetical protein SDRG_16444 [Saprolegnia diclina VS20]